MITAVEEEIAVIKRHADRHSRRCGAWVDNLFGGWMDYTKSCNCGHSEAMQAIENLRNKSLAAELVLSGERHFKP